MSPDVVLATDTATAIVPEQCLTLNMFITAAPEGGTQIAAQTRLHPSKRTRSTPQMSNTPPEVKEQFVNVENVSVAVTTDAVTIGLELTAVNVELIPTTLAFTLTRRIDPANALASNVNVIAFTASRMMIDAPPARCCPIFTKRTLDDAEIAGPPALVLLNTEVAECSPTNTTGFETVTVVAKS